MEPFSLTDKQDVGNHLQCKELLLHLHRGESFRGIYHLEADLWTVIWNLSLLRKLKQILWYKLYRCIGIMNSFLNWLQVNKRQKDENEWKD